MVSELTWRCRDGRILKIEGMTSVHLVHCLHMLQRGEKWHIWRGAFLALGYACSASTPDGASMCAEQEADQMMWDAHDPEKCFESLLRRDARARMMMRTLKSRGYDLILKKDVWKQPELKSE